MYTGLEYSDSGVQAIRAVFTLWALAGQLDVPGGLLFRMKENIFPQNRSRLIPNPDVRKALGRDRFPVYSAYRGESHAIALPEAVLNGNPYPIRALIVLGGSLDNGLASAIDLAQDVRGAGLPGLHQSVSHRGLGLCRHRPPRRHLL